jgi:hypothetical protein
LKRGKNVVSFFDPPNILGEAQGGRLRHSNHRRFGTFALR